MKFSGALREAEKLNDLIIQFLAHQILLDQYYYAKEIMDQYHYVKEIISKLKKYGTKNGQNL